MGPLAGDPQRARSARRETWLVGRRRREPEECDDETTKTRRVEFARRGARLAVTSGTCGQDAVAHIPLRLRDAPRSGRRVEQFFMPVHFSFRKNKDRDRASSEKRTVIFS